MKLSEVLRLIDGKVISKEIDLDTEVTSGGGADLMSDVLAFAQDDMLLMTGLTNPQVIRTAEMAGTAAVVFVRSKIPPAETIVLAEQRGIPLLASRYTMFETCGRLYRGGLPAHGLFELTLRRWHDAFEGNA
jgi:predicted transcriptional regulator